MRLESLKEYVKVFNLLSGESGLATDIDILRELNRRISKDSNKSEGCYQKVGPEKEACSGILPGNRYVSHPAHSFDPTPISPLKSFHSLPPEQGTISKRNLNVSRVSGQF